MTAPLKEQLREAMDGVTPGPWEAEQSNSRKYLDAVIFRYRSGAKGTVALVGKDYAEVGASELDEQNANSAFIALCHPENIAALLDQLDATEGRLREAEEVIREIADPFSAMRRRAEAEGARLSDVAYAIANDANHLKSIAARFLAKETHDVR